MKFIVIGAGSWGTALACVLAQRQHVSLWTNTPEQAADIDVCRENKKYLSGIALPANIRPVPKFSEPVDSEDIAVIAVPSHQVRALCSDLKSVAHGRTIICASKGFEHKTMKTMSQIVQEEMPQSPVVVLTGPNIAREIAECKPAKAVLASLDFAALTRVARQMKQTTLNFELCNDVKGVELCAALKGVIAIGVGIADGLKLGNNFTGLIMTYGLKEFTAVSEYMGISQKTIYGIAGLGDVIATCFSPESRNRKFGYLIGTGTDRDSALKQVGMVVEGVQMAKTICDLDEVNIPIPLFATVARIIFEPNGHLPHKFVTCLTNYRPH